MASMWLAHHAAEHHDRCVLIGSRPVCRRCLVLYPLCLVVMVAQIGGVVPARTGLWVMWLAPIPVVVEWVLEQFGAVTYSSWRQVATSLLAAPALGIALGRHTEHPFAASAVVPMLTAGSICLAAWWVATRRSPQPPGRASLTEPAEQPERCSSGALEAHSQ